LALSDPRSKGDGKLTDSSFERALRRLGIPTRLPNPPHNYEVTWDGSRHFAHSYGDDNPLYCDPDYGRQTRWRDLIAPPAFVYAVGEDACPEPTAEQKELLRGDPWAGLGAYQAVMSFEWWRPFRRGDRIRTLRAMVGVVDRPSEFGGRAAHETRAQVYANQRGEVVAMQRGVWVHVERGASRARKKDDAAPQPYSAEQLAEIDACYEAEIRAGAVPRYFEDVQIGDVLPPKVKGPLRTTEIVLWHLGAGMGNTTPAGAFGLSYRVRRKVPRLFSANALNVPDTAQRLHWEPERARELGLPTSYDYGAMRETWLAHLLTDWMGDDGWLWKLRCEHRHFNFVGDTTWITGRVVDKRQDDGRNEVHIEVECKNQRGQVTSPGSAVVLLPTRENPVVSLPDPPARTMEEMIAADIRRIQEQRDAG
jgi:acyl dehydratase